MPMRNELFIYYRAAVVHAETVELAVQSMQGRLADRHPGLEARLLRRVERSDGEITWMESYALPAGADPQLLAQAIDTAAQTLAPWIVGPRHLEHFVLCVS